MSTRKTKSGAGRKPDFPPEGESQADFNIRMNQVMVDATRNMTRAKGPKLNLGCLQIEVNRRYTLCREARGGVLEQWSRVGRGLLYGRYCQYGARELWIPDWWYMPWHHMADVTPQLAYPGCE